MLDESNHSLAKPSHMTLTHNRSLGEEDKGDGKEKKDLGLGYWDERIIWSGIIGIRFWRIR